VEISLLRIPCAEMSLRSRFFSTVHPQSRRQKLPLNNPTRCCASSRITPRELTSRGSHEQRDFASQTIRLPEKMLVASFPFAFLYPRRVVRVFLHQHAPRPLLALDVTLGYTVPHTPKQLRRMAWFYNLISVRFFKIGLLTIFSRPYGPAAAMVHKTAFLRGNSRLHKNIAYMKNLRNAGF
jgi:hypothetical protein